MLTGKTFGLLTVIERRGSNKHGSRLWLCQCACGSEALVTGSILKAGRQGSCGCLRRQAAARNLGYSSTHGKTKTGEYRSWKSMVQRCLNPNAPKYAGYGGRGITICVRWRESFEAFLEDMGPRPSPRHSIDRIDVNGNYEPGNCRWATPVEQARNRRAPRRVASPSNAETAQV